MISTLLNHDISGECNLNEIKLYVNGVRKEQMEIASRNVSMIFKPINKYCLYFLLKC